MKAALLYIVVSLKQVDSRPKWTTVSGPISRGEAALAVAAEWKLGRMARAVPDKPVAKPSRKPA